MREITLLHIGDIHYESIDKDDRPVDMKDEQFPYTLAGILPKTNYQAVIKAIIEEIGKSPLAILISGDLSTKGKIDGYINCLMFLKELVPLNFFDNKPFQKLFIVPGNHDVNRDLVSDRSLFPKFKPINDALEEKNFPKIPCPTVNFKQLHKDAAGAVLIVTINSCVGCGERRFYPDKIKDKISEFLNQRGGEKDSEEFLEFCYEDIDTPIFAENDIDEMIKYIDSLNKKCLPVILTHHNLLPQRKPRIAMYSELINSGYIREKLLRLNRPILYLHGHIHDDPVEIIQSTRYENSRIICISAPLLFPNKKYKTRKFGFNKIKIIYSHKGNPLGCKITLYNLYEGHKEEKEERIRFFNPPYAIDDETEGDKAILGSILQSINNKYMIYLVDLEEKVKKENGENLSIEEIEEFIDQLSWLGLVEYKPIKDNFKLGTVRKVIP